MKFCRSSLEAMEVCAAKTARRILLGGLGRDLVLDVAGDDGGVTAPDVHLEGEVVADEGNLVVLDGGVDDGIGVGAGGALEVFELVDGDLGSGGGLSMEVSLKVLPVFGGAEYWREGGNAERRGRAEGRRRGL